MENDHALWQYHLSTLLYLVGLCQLLQWRLLWSILAPIILHCDRAHIYNHCFALSQWEKLCNTLENPRHHGVRKGKQYYLIATVQVSTTYAMFQSGNSTYLGQWLGPICSKCAETRRRASSSLTRHWIDGCRHSAFAATMARTQNHCKTEESSTISSYFITTLLYLCFDSRSIVDFLLFYFVKFKKLQFQFYLIKKFQLVKLARSKDFWSFHSKNKMCIIEDVVWKTFDTSYRGI